MTERLGGILTGQVWSVYVWVTSSAVKTNTDRFSKEVTLSDCEHTQTHTLSRPDSGTGPALFHSIDFCWMSSSWCLGTSSWFTRWLISGFTWMCQQRTDSNSRNTLYNEQEIRNPVTADVQGHGQEAVATVWAEGWCAGRVTVHLSQQLYRN